MESFPSVSPQVVRNLEESNLQWIDAHCHIQFDDNPQELIARARAEGVSRMVVVGTDEQTSREAIALAKTAGEIVRATVGQHPHEAKHGTGGIEAILREFGANDDHPIVGIGECGLDYFYDFSPRLVQKDVFRKQISLAHENDLALVIHTRDAWDDTFEILRSEGVPTRSVLHCFTGGLPEMEIGLELGLWISFSGIVTFKNSTKVQEAAQFCPKNRMMIETDSPYLSPVPFRGKPNEPSRVGIIGTFLSQLRGVEARELSETLSRNTKEFFRLNPL